MDNYRLTKQSPQYQIASLKAEVARLEVYKAEAEEMVGEINRYDDEVARLKSIALTDAKDAALTDTDIRKQLSRVLPHAEVYGNSDVVPTIGDLVEVLVGEVDKARHVAKCLWEHGDSSIGFDPADHPWLEDE